jgi:monofunctional biosynthetic peptidoglycan transglycosylase
MRFWFLRRGRGGSRTIAAAPAATRPRWLRRALWILAALVFAPHALLLVYRLVPPPLTPLMVIRLVQGEALERRWVGLDAVSPSLAYAVIAAEDNRFCTHGGVDWAEMQSAIDDYQSGERTRGASTITMQTVKNLVLWPGRDVVRKGIEIWLAHYLELIWPKARIVEVYLNVAEWGPGIYGAEAAALHYFGKAARRLSPLEASLLAAVLPSPRRWRPDRPSGYVSGRATIIRRRTDQLGPLLDCVRR